MLAQHHRDPSRVVVFHSIPRFPSAISTRWVLFEEFRVHQGREKKMGLLKEQNNRRFGAPWDDDVSLRKGWRRAALIPKLTVLSVLPRDRAMANYIENLSQFLQSFGVAALALLFLPVLIAALARNVALALAASLLSFTSLMLFIAPTSATSGLALASGLGSFLVAVVSAVARGRMIAFDKQVADLTSRVNQLESAEQRRLAIEVKRRGLRK